MGSHAVGRGRAAVRGEAGFTMIEVLVAIALVGTLMASLTVFFANSLAFTGQKRGEQIAAQLADDAVERVRAVDGSALLAGRGRIRSTEQWTTAHPAIAPHLQTMALAWDPLLDVNSDSGANAPLPTSPRTVSVGGVDYAQHWYVGRCRQQALADVSAAERACDDPTTPDPDTTSADVPFFRVVAAVTWSGKNCADTQCVYVTTTLVSPALDALFNINRPPPNAITPPARYGYRGVAAKLQLTATGGRLPLTWSATGLPAGMGITPGGLISGTPTTAGTYTVTATVTDRQGDSDNARFSWTVYNLPQLTDPGDRTTRADTAVSLPLTATGGWPALTWSATGLPDGLSINTSTGVVSGTPTTYQTETVTVTITDQGGMTDSETFTWTILTLELDAPQPRTNYVGDSVTGFDLAANGGEEPYTWSAQNLPTGLSINTSTGDISGTLQQAGQYSVTVRVADSAGDSVSQTFTWTVQTKTVSTLRITNPVPSAPNQSTRYNKNTSLTLGATGGTGGYTWQASGLPPGLTLSGSKISGRPYRTGDYAVTLTVRDGSGAVKTLSLNWNVRW
ncbi:putative Ig domain-containing protein [Planomonospora sp. ID82291]|uniref:putative Ig domain-containing protein n=1 Tax=Planomonospora sp. ID82291 TaxID=2738136 RepID=UPI0018C3B56E|nr:putative Ig domain-containing protein [Planomonospora sp. ID82291]MBG0813119.1 putative Ig domain-containing protein [Planomonospora sp. ID82291]